MKKFKIIYPGISNITKQVLTAMFVDLETVALFSHNIK